MGALTSLCSDQHQKDKSGQSSSSPTLKSSRVFPNGPKSHTYDSTVMSSTRSIPFTAHSHSPEMSHPEPLSINPEGEDHLAYKLSMRFCDFEILGQLGTGNFGKVYQVALKNEQGQRGQAYALKKLSRKQFGSARTIQNIRLERQILISIKHQFLTHLKYSFADQDYIYLVMECATGGSVQSLLSLKKIQGSKKNHRALKFRELGQEGVRFITACTVLGMEELHRNKIMYRDLKPENVLIFADGYVKLADFGLAKVLEKTQLTKTQAGTVSYFAPEVIAKQGYNKLIDFWTLGVFIYELATSESPFRHDQILTRSTFKEKVIQAEQNRDWKGFKMGPELKDLINQLLKFNPDERLGAAGYDQIKSHPFFKDTDWNKLLKKELPSPLLPILVACPFKTAEIKGRPFIKKTLSFNLDLDNEWTYDCKLQKTQSSE